ncbi:hypothetical protein F4824DRAFT_491977 [Ustulina deusta]|nr:hypothetical protein F4824DRAFT_491977 [Ustulina deusta]
MAGPNRAPNAFVRVARRIYNPIGFRKGYNFVLWLIFLGVFLAFSVFRLQYLDFDGVFCSEIVKSKFNHAAPGECFYFLQKPYKTGIIMHLFCILPAAILACVQFVPVIRQKATIVHRVNGFIVISLSFVGTAGAFVILPRSFGGGLDIQVVVGTLGASFLWALLMAYLSIQSLQIDKHRKWMLRAWFWAGSIITTRIMQIILLKAFDVHPAHYAMPCCKVDSMLHDRTLTVYPECASFYSGENLQQNAVVRPSLINPTSAAEAAAALDSTFGMASFLAFFLHSIGLELYLRLTPGETERLRDISYKRQREAALEVYRT